MHSKVEVAVMLAGDGAAPGRWEVVAALGEGGYAEVYKVRNALTSEAQRVRASSWLHKHIYTFIRHCP